MMKQRFIYFSVAAFGVTTVLIVLCQLPDLSIFNHSFRLPTRPNTTSYPDITVFHTAAISSNTDAALSKKLTTTLPPTTNSGAYTHELKQTLMFLKTHKTGSSTLQNVFARYAYKHDRFVGLPHNGILFSYLSGSRFNRKMMRPVPANRKLEVLMHHMRFNYNEVKEIMPPDSIYVSILRDPVTQFESVFKYLRNQVRSFQLVKSPNPLSEFLSHPEKYFDHTGGLWWFGKNNMFFDFGYQNTNENDEYIKKAIREIDEIFDLVLISDYFDISMLLLKDLMCWNFEDILYLTINARTKSTVEKIDENQAEKIRSWNKADNAVYQYFNSTFWKCVENYGKERMEKDLKTLAEMNEKLQENCFEDNPILNSQITDKKFKMFNPAGIKIDQYILKKETRNNETCSDLILPEFQWVGKLSRKQYGQDRLR